MTVIKTTIKLDNSNEVMNTSDVSRGTEHFSLEGSV